MANAFQLTFDIQREHFLSDVTKSHEGRIDQLDRMEPMLCEHHDEFCAAFRADLSQPPFGQQFEIPVPTDVIRYYREHLRELMAPRPVAIPKALILKGKAGVVYKEPYGVTLVMGPFNVPNLLLLYPAIAALATGNTVILKPTNTTPATAAILQKYVGLYFGPENVAVVTGGRQEISALLELPFDFIFFTGSRAVGKIVMRAAAEHLTRCCWNSAGKALVSSTNPPILTLRLTGLPRKGTMVHRARYVYVHERVADAFLAKLKASITRMYGKDLERSPDYMRRNRAGNVGDFGSWL